MANGDVDDEDKNFDEDIAIDAELFGEEEDSSAKYTIPNELVTTTYKPVEARSIAKDIALNARIILPGAAPPDEIVGTHRLAAYEEALVNIASQFPLRVARLRDLHERVQTARKNWLLLQEREEQARVNHNRRSEAVNNQLAGEEGKLRAWWESERGKRTASVKVLRDEKSAREAEISNSVQEAQLALWHTRREAAKHRDEVAERVALKTERAAEEAAIAAREEANAVQQQQSVQREEVRQKNQARIELREQDALKRSEDARRLADNARKVAADAEASAYTCVELKIAAASGELDAARIAHFGALQDAAVKDETSGADVRDRADTLTQTLLNERIVRQQGLDELQHSIEAERTSRAAQHSQSRYELASASAKAGLHPGEAESDLEDALRRKLSEEAEVTAVANTEHLLPEAPSRLSRNFIDAGIILATIVCGMIFGISLGLITMILPPSLSVMFEEPAKPLCVGLLGTFLFLLMGHLIERAATYAAEELHAETERPGIPGTSRRSMVITITLGALLLLLIGIECTVERYGIIKTVLNSSKDAFGRSTGSSLSGIESFSYWLVAAIASVPFVLYHAYDARLRTRYRIAHSRRKQHFAKQQQIYLHRAEVEAVCEAVERVREAQRRLDALDAERETEIADVRRSIAAIDAEIDAHPLITAARNWEEQSRVRATVESTPLVLQTKEVYEDLLSLVEKDPLVKAARSRAAELAAQADILEQEARSAASKAGSVWADVQEAGRAVASGVVQGVGGTVRDAFLEAGHAYAGANGEQTGQAVGGASVSAALRLLNTPAIPSAGSGAQIAWQVGNALADAVRSSGDSNVAKIKQETSDAEQAAIRTLEEARGLLRDDASTSDPQIAHLRGRIRALKREVASFDQTVKNRVTQLRRQRQQYLPDLSEEARRRIQDAQDQLISAQALLEEELLMLERLVTTPKAARWFVAWSQTHANNAPMLKRIYRAQNTRQLALPANE